MDIANEMYRDENFDIKLESEKDEIANMLWGRWKVTRDNYTRELKKVKKGNYTSSFVYYNQLTFLGDRPTRAKRQPRKPGEKKKRPTKQIERHIRIVKDETPEEEEEMEYEYEEISNENETNQEHEIFIESEEGHTEEADGEQMTEITTQENQESLLLALNEIVNKRERRELDEHELFLQSLLPDLRKVPSSKKLRVRMDILSIINKALQE